MRDILVPGGVEGLADAADAPIHHVRRRDDIDAGLGLRERLAQQRIERLVVEDAGPRAAAPSWPWLV